MKRYIKSDSGFGVDFDVFMLMRYVPDSGENGMAGDKFYCEGKFFASNLSEAEAEFKALQQKYPRLKNYYVDEYNEEFDTADWQQPPLNPMDTSYNVFADVETLVEYLGLDGVSPENYSVDLPFEI